MQLKTGINSRKELYNLHLRQVREVLFTNREIDVIACILHNRGEKKIASLLSISPRTVSTHAHNIMLKLGKSSREGIIDFVETSGKLSFLREYYIHLLVQNSFESHLFQIAKTINSKQIDCTFYQSDLGSAEKLTLEKLHYHLKLASVRLISETAERKTDHKLFILNEGKEYSAKKNEYFLLFSHALDVSKLDKTIDFIDLREPENYYFSVLKLLKQIIDNPELDNLIEEFKKKFYTITTFWDIGKGIAEVFAKEQGQSFYKSRSFIAIFSILLLALIFKLFLGMYNKDVVESIVGSDLPIPKNDVLLDRSDILGQMRKKLSQKTGIQAIALIGVGGSGKTVLARRYARQSDASIIWEIDAETKDTIIISLQRLAYAICKSPEQRQEINQILQLQDISEQEKKLLVFLSKLIKTYPGWLIIYDNVKSFHDIEKYFFYDPTIWGRGKIIITTSNANIIHSNYIATENIIPIRELHKEEQLELFTSIIQPNGTESLALKNEYIHCLDNIPPFPLDVSIAAHYIKETQIPCNKYLEYNSTPSEVFLYAQKNVLCDIGEYSKTRYDIINLSIKRIMEMSENFQDLLFLISIVDSQNIPKKLLTTYKDEIVVDNFLYELKKFSLITQNINSISTISLHRSTQDIILTHFIHKQIQDSKLLQDVVLAIKNYVASELENYDLEVIQLLIPHVESFLNRGNLFDEFDKTKLNNELGICYFYVANYNKAKILLEKTLSIYEKYYGKNHINTAKTLAKLGIVHRNIGNYKTAETMLQEAILVYEEYFGEKHPATAEISVYLGSVYRNIGKDDLSIAYLKRAREVYLKLYGEKHIKTIHSYAYLGTAYKDIGNYDEALPLLENAYNFYEQYYGKDHTKTAWCATCLASLYREIGRLDDATKLINYARKVYLQHNDKNSMEIAWTLAHLGVNYIALGQTEKAVETLTKSLSFYNQHLKSDHIIIGWIKYHLGEAYQILGSYETAENLLLESLNIHNNYYDKDNFRVAKIMYTLGKVYDSIGDKEKAKQYISKALEIFTLTNHPYRHKVSLLK